MALTLSRKSGGLDQLRRTLTNLADPAFKVRLHQAVADTVLQLTQDRFDSATSPSGQTWRARKDRLPHPLLQKSGKLRTSLRPTATTSYAQVATTSVPYASYQNRGTRFMPAREFLPTSALPANYAAKIAQAVSELLKNA